MSEFLHSSLLPPGSPIQKPAKGAHRAARLAVKAHEDYIEDKARQDAKKRDGHQCRRPGCSTNLRQWRLEAAHIEDEGMGGRHSVGDRPACYVSVCCLCHQGERSLHSGDLRVIPLTDRGGDGLVRWEEAHEGGWRVIGVN